MKIKMRTLAICYVIVGVAMMAAALVLGVLMFLSGTFLPVYIAGTYVVGNQIVRYVLYILLAVILFFSAKLANYGAMYLTRKLRRRMGR